MSRILKRLGIVLAIFVGLILLAVTYTQVSAELRLRRTYDIAVEPIAIPTDEAAMERGRQLVEVGRCVECHGVRLGGQVAINDPSLGQIYASNLTTGKGGVGRDYTDDDWVRALRHGIGPDGRSLVITPAQYYYYLSDADLGAIIAYIKSVPPVDNEVPSPSVAPLGRVFLTLLSPKEWLPAEKIDHASPRPVAPERGVTAEYGEYLARLSNCQVCHTQVAEISAGPEGNLADWTEEDFMRLMRSGRTPEGNRVNSEFMPYWSTGRLDDNDLRAMWLYLKTLPG